MPQPRLVTLIILDGWGMATANAGNAITNAKTPNFDRYWVAYPHTYLSASGESVGLPRGEMGNSETGHMNIGAGSIVYQDLPRIDMAIAEGTFFKMPALNIAANHVKSKQSRLHLMGLVSDGGIHASLNHLFALMRFAKDQGIAHVYLHLFTDGRDASPNSAMTYIDQVKQKIEEIGIGEIASICGRYYAMDRDLRWERIEKAYNMLVLGEGEKITDILKAINDSYAKGITDEFIEPLVVVTPEGNPVGTIQDSDAVIFYNYRVDRPRQLSRAFVINDFETMQIAKREFDPYAERYGLKQYELPKDGTTTFKRKRVVQDIYFVTMTEYERNLPADPVFEPILIQMPIGRVISQAGLRQIHTAETEKFPHVTYFFNGGRAEKFTGEEQVISPSPKVATYDLQPEMSIYQVTESLLTKIRTRTYQFVIVNFANPDMVAHTGNLEASIKACEHTDICLGKVVSTVSNLGGVAIVTADHGNAEELIDLATGEPDTKHSTNPVPFIVIDSQNSRTTAPVLPRGILADISPTILGIMGLPQPSSMTGRNLLKIF